jgi:hypothetical protein
MDKDNALQNTYMPVLFASSGTKSLASVGKFVYNINANPNSPQKTNSFFQTYTNSTISIF